MQCSRYLIGFSHEKNLPDAGIDDVFFWINPVEKCTQSFGAMSTEEK
jgi:hypothetical protein